MMTAVPAVITITMIESVRMFDSGTIGSEQLVKSCPRSASATMPVAWRIASAMVR
jgi:hypothetical protein